MARKADRLQCRLAVPQGRMDMSTASSLILRALPETTAAATTSGGVGAGASSEPADTAAAASMPAAPVNQSVETFDRTADQTHPAPATTRPAKTLKERLRWPLMLGFPILLAAFGAAYYFVEEPYVSTTDAFVRAAKITVNARVAGQAVAIAVRDNQRVKQGQLLFQIDPEPYQIAVDQAEARLASARLQIDGLKATYRQQQAELQSAKDTAAYDQREYERKKALVANDFATRQIYDQTETALKVA